MSCFFQKIDPPPPPCRPASVYPRLWCRGEDILAGWKGGGGGRSIFWKKQDIGSAKAIVVEAKELTSKLTLSGAVCLFGRYKEGKGDVGEYRCAYVISKIPLL
jgi:hypothetical protein